MADILNAVWGIVLNLGDQLSWQVNKQMTEGNRQTYLPADLRPATRVWSKIETLSENNWLISKVNSIISISQINWAAKIGNRRKKANPSGRAQEDALLASKLVNRAVCSVSHQADSVILAVPSIF